MASGVQRIAVRGGINGQMATDRLINILVTMTLIEMMAAIGLGMKLADIGGLLRNRGLLARAAIANYLCVPVVTVVLLLWVQSPPMIAAGFLVVSVCPGAAYGLPLTALAKGNVGAAVGLMVLLASSSAILAPPLLRLLLPLMAQSQSMKIDTTKMIETLLVSQMLPLFAGLGLREWRPNLAGALKRPADRVSGVLNMLILSIIFVVHFRMLIAIRLLAFAGMLALVISSLIVGWLLGESGSKDRKAMGFSTSVRNVAVALVITTATFPVTPAVTAALVYGLFQTIVLAGIALAWGRPGVTTKPVVSETGHESMIR
jgi:bile acid:Na+ symporter, BASS family